MKDDGRIPVVVGVTGHRDLREQDREVLKEAVRGELAALKAKCPNSPLVVMTSLAEGADQLCAETALELGIPHIAVLPLPLSEYAKDFEELDVLDRLMYLVEASAECIEAPALEEYDERFGRERDWHYRQAGLYIAKHSHVLLALWNGTEGDENSCGTAAITASMLNGNFGQSKSRQLHPNDRTVIQIVTPRARKSSPEGLTAGEVIKHGEEAVLEKMLEDTDSFNLDIEKYVETGEAAPDDENGDKVRARLKRLYDTADHMSLDNAAKHRRVLIGLSIAATALAIDFLLYDEAEWHWMIILCGILIISLFVINRISSRSGYQKRYLEYRVLAEALRVQKHLRDAGIACEVSEIMPWNLQLAMPWIRNAVSAAMIGAPAAGRSRIKESWIIDQRDYHKEALGRSIKKLGSNDRILRAALIMTLALYAFALIFEIVWGGLFGGRPAFTPEMNYTIRMIIKIAMGTAAAGTLFAGNYYGKQALPNVIDDHCKMLALYEDAAYELDRLGENEEFLIRLAEDELNENANWYAYQSKSEPDLGI